MADQLAPCTVRRGMENRENPKTPIEIAMSANGGRGHLAFSGEGNSDPRKSSTGWVGTKVIGPSVGRNKAETGVGGWVQADSRVDTGWFSGGVEDDRHHADRRVDGWMRKSMPNSGSLELSVGDREAVLGVLGGDASLGGLVAARSKAMDTLYGSSRWGRRSSDPVTVRGVSGASKGAALSAEDPIGGLALAVGGHGRNCIGGGGLILMKASQLWEGFLMGLLSMRMGWAWFRVP